MCPEIIIVSEIVCVEFSFMRWLVWVQERYCGKAWFCQMCNTKAVGDLKHRAGMVTTCQWEPSDLAKTFQELQGRESPQDQTGWPLPTSSWLARFCLGRGKSTGKCQDIYIYIFFFSATCFHFVPGCAESTGHVQSTSLFPTIDSSKCL